MPGIASRENREKLESAGEKTASSPHPSPPEEERERVSQTRSKIAWLGKRSTARRQLIFPSKSIADLLESTIEEAIVFLTAFPNSRPAQRAVESLGLLAEVGLGYLKLGQPINTLSGGESQRLKLVRHLAESDGAGPVGRVGSDASCSRTHHASRFTYDASALNPRSSTLFLFDEPTTGLHFDD